MSELFDAPPATASRFEEFWKLYPSGRKTNKKGCLEKWRAKRLDGKADVILEDVRWRSKFHEPWLKDDGKYVPMPSTYLAQERWNDDRKDVRDKKHKGAGGNIARLGVPEVRRGALALLLKRYPDEIICKTFGLSGSELAELKREGRSYEMPPLRPGDEHFVGK